MMERPGMCVQWKWLCLMCILCKVGIINTTSRVSYNYTRKLKAHVLCNNNYTAEYTCTSMQVAHPHCIESTREGKVKQLCLNTTPSF